MKKEEFKQKYPNLMMIVEEVSLCNGMARYEKDEIVGLFGESQITEDEEELEQLDLDKLEAQASKMTEDERAIFADGEYEEIRALVDKYDLEYLDSFISEVFDGVYSAVFWQRTP